MLNVEPLTVAAFAPFGDVIECRDDAVRMRVNEGYAERFHDLATVDLGDFNGVAGRPLISIFRTQPRALPLTLSVLERHPLGSQAFVPLAPCTCLIVVAPGDRAPDLDRVRCFLAGPGQGINYARGVWHHPLLTLHAACDFLAVDRGGQGVNLEEFPLPAGVWTINFPL